MNFFSLFRLQSLLVMAFMPLLALAQHQNDLVVYLDSLEQVANDDNYYVMRVFKDYYSQSKGCLVYDYYKSGQKRAINRYDDKFSMLKSGEFITFYENGNKASLFHFVNNIPVGKFYTWHEKGNIKTEGEFIQFKDPEKPIMKVNQHWSRIGVPRVVNGVGPYEDEGTTWYANGQLVGGLKDGDWDGYDILTKSNFRETYKQGILLSGVSVDSLKNEFPFHELTEEAKPNMSAVKFKRYLKDNIQLPAHFADYKVEGTIVVLFDVSKEGTIKNPKVLYSMGPSLDREIIRVFSASAPWIPARQRGIPIESQALFPIEIRNGKI